MKKFLLVLFFFVLVLFVMLFVFFDDTQTNHYATLGDAKADGAIERGWVPSIIPASAYDITEKHNLDANAFRGSFSYHKEDMPHFMEALKIIDANRSIYQWEDTLFYIDTKEQKVWYRNKAQSYYN